VAERKQYLLWSVRHKGYRAGSWKRYVDTPDGADRYSEGAVLDIAVDLAVEPNPEWGYVLVLAPESRN